LLVAGDNALVGLQRVLPGTDSLAAYLTAGGVVAGATIIKFPLDGWAGENLPPYITYYPALVLATLCGGPRVGFVTAAATLLLAWYFWLPIEFSFTISGARTPLTIGIYAVSSALLAWAIGLARLVLDQVVANEAERALSARESVHRIKNVIAVVQALAAKIAKEVSTPEEYKQVITKRLEALGAAQNVLIKEDWSDANLKQMIESALAPFLPNPGLAVEAGPDMVVPARHVNGLCLALYELSTNAMKYGALADGEGPVVLSWRCEKDDCVLEWREARKRAAAEDNSGFGSVLIKTALSNAPDTHVDYEFTPREVVAVFRWPSKTGV
jgi:two-component sensor histidine kinase